jgi:hypothetical protein
MLRSTSIFSALGTVVVADCLIGLAGCAGLASGTATPDNLALPITIPAGTVQAWHSGPIETRLQAAIAAQAALCTTRLYYAKSPPIVLVERMGLPEAQRRVATNDGPTSGIDVWLVIFEGNYQIYPPVSPTPIPSVHGCAFVMLDAAGGAPVQAGTKTTCP